MTRGVRIVNPLAVPNPTDEILLLGRAPSLGGFGKDGAVFHADSPLGAGAEFGVVGDDQQLSLIHISEPTRPY